MSLKAKGILDSILAQTAQAPVQSKVSVDENLLLDAYNAPCSAFFILKQVINASPFFVVMHKKRTHVLVFVLFTLDSYFTKGLSFTRW